MANFFSAIQNKFKSAFHGRYIGHIIEQIAEFHPQIVLPLLLVARNSNSGKPDSEFRPTKLKLLNSIESVSTEVDFLNRQNDDDNDRRADIEILLNIDEKRARVLVEIKMFDSFLLGQLQDYIDWANKTNEIDDVRKVVILTAYPLSNEEMQLIYKSPNICHMYLSDLTEQLDTDFGSELIDLFKKYMYEEGYAMYKLEADSDDYKAFESFMVLNFLPHASGKGRVVSVKKISRGPVVFSNLVQNWQLISDRLSSSLNFPRKPTVRYFPEQCGGEANGIDPEFKEGLLIPRTNVRRIKTGGRYWLNADQVLPGSNNLRLEWGQVMQIEREVSDSDVAVSCWLYAFVRRGRSELSYSRIKPLKKGVVDKILYSPEEFLDTLLSLVNDVVKKAENSDQELTAIFKNLKLTK